MHSKIHCIENTHPFWVISYAHIIRRLLIKSSTDCLFTDKSVLVSIKLWFSATPAIRIPDPESIDENRHNLQNKSELRVTSLESHRFLILFQSTTKMYYECCIWNSIINRKEKWIQGTVVYFSEIGKEFWRRLQTWVFENSSWTSFILNGCKNNISNKAMNHGILVPITLCLTL